MDALPPNYDTKLQKNNSPNSETNSKISTFEPTSIQQKYTLLFRSYGLIFTQFLIYTVFILIFSQVTEICDWIQNPSNSWFYITLSAVSWGFLLIGHILMRFKKLNETILLDAGLFLGITLTMGLWVAAASAYHEKLLGAVIVFSCLWTLGFVIFGVLVYSSLFFSKSSRFGETLKNGLANPSVMFTVGCLMTTISFLITTIFTYDKDYYGQIMVSGLVTAGLVFWIVFSTYYMGQSYGWKRTSGLAVTLEMYVKTMLVVILAIKIWELFAKCCCESKEEVGYDNAADVEIEPVETGSRRIVRL